MTPFNEPSRLRVLVTGGAGKIGTALRSHWRGRYGLLRLADIAAQEPAGAGEEICQLDMRDITSVEKSMEDMDCVVHLAGIPHEDTWDNILSVNIEGTYNAFEAARRQGVRRVVFASSNHVIGFHRREEVVDTDAQPRPDSRYGVSKVFGEALGSMYADKYGLSVACLRIGPFRTPDKPNAPRELMNWLSHADMAQLAGQLGTFRVLCGAADLTEAKRADRPVMRLALADRAPYLGDLHRTHAPTSTASTATEAPASDSACAAAALTAS